MAMKPNCLHLVQALPQQDQDAILERLEALQSDGVPAERAQIQAAVDVLVKLQREEAATGRLGTPEFRRWFANSKVVDADGKPLVMYHATTQDFGVFQANARGVHFVSPSSDWVAKFLKDDRGNVADGANVMPVYVSASKPFDYQDKKHVNALASAASLGSLAVSQIRKGDWRRLEDRTLLAAIMKLGFDGLYVNEDGVKNLAVFSPEQIKSAIGNNGQFEPENPDITRSAERPKFISQLEVAIAGVPDRLATMAAPQWKLWLDANAGKLGVKKEEVEWSGIKDFLELQGKAKVTRDQLEAYLRDNGVRVTEVVLGDQVSTAGGLSVDDVYAEPGQWTVLFSDGTAIGISDEIAATREDAIDEARILLEDEGSGSSPESSAKYGTYTVPGGENYREVLITLPRSAVIEPVAAEGRWRLRDKFTGEFMRANGNKIIGFDSEAEARVAIGQLADPGMEQFVPGYKSSHWNQKNILAHLRVDDRTDADGKRVLFINEIQSDWGQDGKKKGFKGDAAKSLSAEQERVVRDHYAMLVRQQPRVFDGKADTVGAMIASMGMREVNAAMDDAGLANVDDSANDYVRAGMVPRAPFVTDTKAWAGLALKRAIIMAVEGGHDRLALISGQQAADLYDLSQRIDRIDYSKDGDAYSLSAIKDGREVFSKEGMSESDLEDAVGKEVAAKIIAGEGSESDGAVDRWEPEDSDDSGEAPEVRSLSGLDLKVGGDGMRAFYDQIIPQVARDVLKKIGGGQLGTTEIAAHRDSIQGGQEWTYGIASTAGQPGYSVYERATEKDVAGPFDTNEEARAWLHANDPLTRNLSKNLSFDITPAMREKVAAGVPLFSKERNLDDVKLAAGYTLGDLLKSSKQVSWWDKTVGTPFNLAEKHPETFGRVYNAVQRFISDVSKYATRTADLAPNILPKLETIRDIGKRPLSLADTEALADPVFLGSLKFTRDEEGNAVETDDVGLAGVVWRDHELRVMWKLNDRQIGLYREFRKATNRSLNDLAITDMIRFAGKDATEVRDAMIATGWAQGAANILANHLGEKAAQDPDRAALLIDTARTIKEKANLVQGLIARGYAPLSRFGDYTVYVTRNGGAEQVFFGMYETEREANKAARAFQADPEFKGADVKVGTMSKESYKLFKGVTPETLALFGETLGLEEGATDQKSQVFQAYLQAAKTNRSAMKRMIERKGINGYSEDVGRVLAGFAYSNARQASTNLHAGEISKSAADIQAGDLRDHAIKLVEYVQNPAEEAQAIRGLLFFNYIGGSVASALVNLTQSATTTWPVLSQHFGIGRAGRAMSAAVSVATKGAGKDEDLAKAMKRAELEGITAPQETHQLQAQAAGRASLAAGDGTLLGNQLSKTNNLISKTKLVWGGMFSWAEQMNRKIAFAAAYSLARERGDADPFAFAAKTVAETQYTMNKGNNAPWARGPVGATLFTFRKFMVNYLEGLARMWGAGPEGKKAFALSLGVLFVLAGTGGFPFAEDLDDLIDFFAQRVLGKNWQTKQAKREFFTELLGRQGAEFITQGISGLPGVPMDVSGRLGLGNIAPGTGLLQKKRDYTSDAKEILGAAGDFIGRMASAVAQAAQGDVRNAAVTAAPVALANLIKATQMAQLGYYQDGKGRKVIDTTVAEAVLKGIGFQPVSVANVQEATWAQRQQIDLNKLAEGEIADLWTRGRVEGKPELVEKAKQRLADWNKANPSSPIAVDPAQISRRVRQANMDKAQRLAATAPKEIRRQVKEALAEEK